MDKWITSPELKYGHSELEKDIIALCERFHITRGNAGYSVNGRTIPYLQLGRGKRFILLVGTHHAREYVASALLMRMCESYALSAEKESGMLALLEHVSIIFLPMVNPDGVEIVLGRQQPNFDITEIIPGKQYWKANAQGVDLNRHYPCLFKQKESEPAPASEGFKGIVAATEPEVRAVMRLCNKFDFISALTFHAKGEELFYADSNTPFLTPHALKLALNLSNYSGYRIAPISSNPKIYGAGFENWFRERFNRPCILVELAPYDGPAPFDMKNFESLFFKCENMGKIAALHAFRPQYYKCYTRKI